MDSIGGMEKCPKHITKVILQRFNWKKIMVHNGILM